MTQTTSVSKIIKATLLRSLSNEAETIELEAGRSIAENLTDIDFTNAIVIVNGTLVREQHIVQTGDIVTIRITPSGVVTGIIAAVFTIGAIIAGAYFGNEIYKMKEAAEKAQKELDRMKKMSAKPDLDNRPFLRGASNTLATGNSQPYIIGRHLMTPYLLSKPFYKIEVRTAKNSTRTPSLNADLTNRFYNPFRLTIFSLKHSTILRRSKGSIRLMQAFLQMTA